MKRMKIWFDGLSVIGKTFVVLAVLTLIGTAAPSSQSYNNVTPNAVTNSVQTLKNTPAEITEKIEPKIDIKQLITTEEIPYSSSSNNDSSLDQGVKQIKTKGVNGVLTRTYQVTYTDGVETSRSGPVDAITTPAVNEEILVGTKAPAPTISCKNGTYINSAGNTVCNPYVSS